ncbi:MAG: hypothetical protein ACYCSW_09030 [bacterium]
MTLINFKSSPAICSHFIGCRKVPKIETHAAYVHKVYKPRAKRSFNVINALRYI